MNEGCDPIRVDPSLPQAVEQQIQSRWLGVLQNEFGVLQTNLFMANVRCEALMAQRILDLQHLEGLKIRVRNSDENIRILQDQLRAAQNEILSLTAVKSKRIRRTPV